MEYTCSPCVAIPCTSTASFAVPNFLTQTHISPYTIKNKHHRIRLGSPNSNKHTSKFAEKKMANSSDEFRLASSHISPEGRLPRQYLAEGQGAKRGISPPLEWYNLPEGTKSLALVVQDIDAPDPEGPIVPWTIWVVVNIPPMVKGLPEGISGKEEAGIKEGNSDMKKPGWQPPKLPSQSHRIEFKLYALDDELNLGNKVTKDKLLEAIEGHVLGEAVLIAKS